MVEEDIIKDTRLVPLFVFQLAVPSIEAKRKKPYIEYLKYSQGFWPGLL